MENTMKKAVMLGAGQIGRGFIGMLLEKSGFHVVFADLNEAIINDINTRGEYTVHMVDEVCEDTTVKNISAVSSLSAELIDTIAVSELVCTSVGLTALHKIAPAVAGGIKLRMDSGCTSPLNIIACENAIRASSILKELVYALLSTEAADYAERYIGFPDCAVDRIIPPNADRLPAEVTVEKYHEWDVEIKGFKGEPPHIEGMELVDNLDAYLERKLFTLNGPNAVTAYLGKLMGYTTIYSALEDEWIYSVVYGMMTECGKMLEIRHGFRPEDNLRYRMLLMQRFKNPYVIDSIARVGREPVRKLSPNDRICAPMRYARQYGIETPSYFIGIAAALMYDDANDAQSQQLQKLLCSKGVSSVLSDICAIEGADAAEIETIYKSMKEKYA